MSDKKFRLLRNLVLVLPINSKINTESGIVVTSIDKTAPREGVVVDTGDGLLDKHGKLVPIGYKSGDRVIYSSSILKDLKVGKDVLHIIPATEILCKLVNDEQPQN